MKSYKVENMQILQHSDSHPRYTLENAVHTCPCHYIQVAAAVQFQEQNLRNLHVNCSKNG